MLAFSPTQRLAIAEIVIFSALVLITGFVAFNHGIKGTMCFQMLIGLEAMRIISGSIHLAQNGDPRKFGAGESFAASGTIALLVLVPIGLIYEVCLYIPTIGIWANRLNLALFHAIIIASIVMGTVGASPKNHSDTGDHSPSNPSVSKTGYMLLVICCVVFMAQGIYLLLSRVQQADTIRRTLHLKILIYSMLASLSFAIIRISHMVAYAFDPTPERNPEVGDFTIVFFVVFLTQLFATVPLVLGGVLTRNIFEDGCGGVYEERALREEVVEPKPEHKEHERRGERFV